MKIILNIGFIFIFYLGILPYSYSQTNKSNNSIYLSQRDTEPSLLKPRKQKMLGNYPKFASGILLTTNFNSIEIAIKEFSKALINKDIIPDKTDNELGLLTTEPFQDNNNNSIKLRFIFKMKDGLIQVVSNAEGKINMTLTLLSVSSTNNWLKIINKGGAGSLYKKMFESYGNIIKELPGEIIGYTYEFP